MVSPPATALTWPQVWAHRAARHSLTDRRPASDLLPLVSELCGLHAQVMSSAELTAHARLDGLEPGAIGRALWEDRTLYKSWAMRGTLHLLPTREFNFWSAALGIDEHYLKPARAEPRSGLDLGRRPGRRPDRRDLAPRAPWPASGARGGRLRTRSGLGAQGHRRRGRPPGGSPGRRVAVDAPLTPRPLDPLAFCGSSGTYAAREVLASRRCSDSGQSNLPASAADRQPLKEQYQCLRSPSPNSASPRKPCAP